jgi:luciferase family oxidoreductase group 1
MTKIPISVLELATVIEGGNTQTAISNTVEIAKHAESLGYKRIWMAEHHNMEYIASSATSVLIGHIAGKTNTIRVGSGGIMLPNHSPLVIAEQFGTLESIYPGRIDLGLGRAPGSDQYTAMAMRRGQETVQDFPSDIRQLQRYFSANNYNSKVRAFPGEGLDIPIWILGSSTDSAYLAAEMGLPYAFASHFAPARFRAAIKIYRENFKPSATLAKPYMIACVNVLGADTDEEANLLLNSLLNLFVGILTNNRKPLSPNASVPDSFQNPEIRNAVNNMISCTFYGSKETLRKKLSVFIAETGIDELMVASHIFDLEAKLKSFTILKEALELEK